jgi:high-affinity iron transporter
VIDATAVHFFSLPLLGIHPTAQGLSLQVGTLALVAAGLWFNRAKTA